MFVHQFLLQTLIPCLLLSTVSVRSARSVLKSNCEAHVHQDDNSTTTTKASFVHVSQMWAEDIECSIAVTDPTHNSVLSCGEGNMSIKAWIGRGSASPTIRCVAHSLFKVEFEFLDSATDQQRLEYEDGLARVEYEPGEDWGRSIITIEPKGRASTRYKVLGQTPLYAVGLDEDANNNGLVVTVKGELNITLLVIYGSEQPEEVKIYGSRPDVSFLASEDHIVLIPCISGSATIDVSLYEMWPGSLELRALMSFNYDPMQGIYLNLSDTTGNYASNLYLCCPLDVNPKNDSTYSEYCQEFRVHGPSDLIVEPATGSLNITTRYFNMNNETITVELKCTDSGSVKLVGTLDTPFNQDEGPESFVIQSQEIRTDPRARYTAAYDESVPSFSVLNVDCVQGDTNKVLYAWNITTQNMNIEFPSQDFLNFGNLVGNGQEPGAPVFQCCSAQYNDTRLRAIRCENVQHCAILKWCFKSGRCDHLVTEGTRFIVHGHSDGNFVNTCAKLQIPIPGAIFQCSAGGYEYFQTRWLGLSGVFSYEYGDSYNIGSNRSLSFEAVRPVIEGGEMADTHDAILYTRVPYNVTCIYQPFAILSVKFSLELRDDMRSVEEDDDWVVYRVNTTKPSWAVGERIELTFSTLVTSVRCQGHMHGLVNWATGSRDVRVLESVGPTITNDETIFEILEGDPKAISCTTSGLPSAHIEWTLSNQDGTLTMLRGTENSDLDVVNKSVLTFKRFRGKLAGTYVCTARNGVGTVSREFVVSLKNPGYSLWIVIGIPTVIMLVLTAILVLTVRHIILKGRRVLDQVELDEFMYGAPIGANDHYLPLNGSTDGSQTFSSSESEESVTEKEPGSFGIGGAHELVKRPFDPTLQIKRSAFSLDKSRHLGAGAYGSVYAGTVKLERDGGTVTVDVAIKVPQPNCPREILTGLLKEVKIIASLDHENVVRLVGVNITRALYGKLYILMEWCEEGSLEQFLEKNRRWYSEMCIARTSQGKPTRNFGLQELVRWCHETATGLEYLASKDIVHRDVAARNVLLTKDWTAKVSDFGLSRQLYGSPAYEVQSPETQLPVRWMAPECFNGTFNTASDVWAFSIFAWELFSLGHMPYNHIEIIDLAHFADQLWEGLRITERYHATPIIFEKLQECWKEDPRERPTFTELRHFFQQQIHNL